SVWKLTTSTETLSESSASSCVSFTVCSQYMQSGCPGSLRLPWVNTTRRTGFSSSSNISRITARSFSLISISRTSFPQDREVSQVSPLPYSTGGGEGCTVSYIHT